MDEMVYDALVDLKSSIEKQTEMQGKLLATMKALIGTVEENSSERYEFTEVMRAIGQGEKPKNRTV
ncbi:hypothetical protein E4L95_09260 [Paracoccus liaowanqingii]|uniref:Uncharacterized protein n=1 Tax=Paracoccus liaowanqingii TaxID=2560053 RepID=A0A4Z1CCM9_9RHOB|nr:hypothetical protein [Paracoccus liaowanqingii]TGN61743.1 hypothetical protein E4L95_09260 [Paracoccus liaowanqingii]